MANHYLIYFKKLKFIVPIVIFVFLFTNIHMSFAKDALKNSDRNIIDTQRFLLADSTDNTDDDLDDFFEDNTEKDNSGENTEDADDFFSDDEPGSEAGESQNRKDELEEDLQADSDEPGYFINGDLSLKFGYRFNYDAPMSGDTDHSGLSHAKAEINLEFGTTFFEKWDFFISRTAFYNFAYDINDQDDYADKYLDEYESEVALKKLFIRGSLSKDIDLKVGRQIVVWGKSDNIRITDVLNPLDLREPGMTDIEDLRLPVTMTKLDYYYKNLALSAYMIHEHRSHKLPVFGSGYYYLPYAMPRDEEPSRKIENTEYALSLAANFSGFDISFYLADIYEDTPYLNSKNQLRYEDIYMAGVAANKAKGNFLYKTEIGYFDGIRLSAFRTLGGLVDNLHEYSRLDYLLGVEYSGFKNASLSFEAADRWVTDFDDNAEKSGQKEHSVQYAFRGSRTFLNEVFELSLLASLYGAKADDGGFVRVNGAYDYTDSIVFELGAIFYKSGSSALLYNIGENNTIFCSVTYSF